MKKLHTLLAVTLLTISSSCTKNNSTATTYPEENPLQGFITIAGLSGIGTNGGPVQRYEFGFSFKPTVTGKINSLVAKIPYADANLKISIWDLTAKTVLHTESITNAVAGVEVTKAISPITLVQNKEYLVSMNTTCDYQRYRADRKLPTYPITSGNIQITNTYADYAATSTPVLPKTDGAYNGDCSFVFQRTE